MKLYAKVPEYGIAGGIDITSIRETEQEVIDLIKAKAGASEENNYYGNNVVEFASEPFAGWPIKAIIQEGATARYTWGFRKGQIVEETP